jgi:hypothetical protein
LMRAPNIDFEIYVEKHDARDGFAVMRGDRRPPERHRRRVPQLSWTRPTRVSTGASTAGTGTGSYGTSTTGSCPSPTVRGHGGRLRLGHGTRAHARWRGASSSSSRRRWPGRRRGTSRAGIDVYRAVLDGGVRSPREVPALDGSEPAGAAGNLASGRLTIRLKFLY